ncbi:hypothetical protein BSPWISOXPB_4913 [uncultured Gammaproteobacteria bacterium]|nr:hypothetical protein BSPWISOXPB_4913 [uncultured Gammaproteobacteria bacterium]
MLGARLGVVGILAREDVKVLTVYVDLSVICVAVLTALLLSELTALFALAWRFEPTMVGFVGVDVDNIGNQIGGN